MNFDSYMKLKKRAEKAGAADNESLKQLLHIIQAKNVAKEHFSKYIRDMNEWEKNCAEIVEREIKTVQGVDMRGE